MRERSSHALTVTRFSFPTSSSLSFSSSSPLLFHFDLYASFFSPLVISQSISFASPSWSLRLLPLTFAHLLLLSFVQIYNIHNSRLTITITWSVVQPNVRRPLHVHLPLAALKPGVSVEPCLVEEWWRKRCAFVLSGTPQSSIASRTDVARRR